PLDAPIFVRIVPFLEVRSSLTHNRMAGSPAFHQEDTAQRSGRRRLTTNRLSSSRRYRAAVIGWCGSTVIRAGRESAQTHVSPIWRSASDCRRPTNSSPQELLSASRERQNQLFGSQRSVSDLWGYVCGVFLQPVPTVIYRP